MQIITRKKLISFHIFIWKISFFTIFEKFHVTILSKIEIAIDFNGPKSSFLSFNYSKRMMNLFQTSESYSYDHCQQLQS